MVSGSGQKDKREDENLQIAKLKLKLEGLSGLSEYQQKLIEWSENVDKRYAWVILMALFVIMSSTLGTYRMYGLVFAKVTAEGIYSRQDASWPVSMIYTTENVFGPLVSVATYYLSVRKTIFIGAILVTTGNLITYFSDNFATDVIFLGLVQGVGYSFCLMPFMQIVNNYFLRYRNIALGLALCGGTISVFVFTPIFQYILDNYPWRTAYLVVSLFCSLIFVMAPLLRPNERPNLQEYIGDENRRGGRKGSSAEQQMSRNSLSRISKRALSYRNSMSMQTMLITHKTLIDPKSGLPRRESVISMNPFASTAAIERRISHYKIESGEVPALATIPDDYEPSINPDGDKKKNQSSPIGRQFMKKASIYSTDSHLVINCGNEPCDQPSNFDDYNSIIKSTIALQQQNETMSIISDAICSDMENIRRQDEFETKLLWDIVKNPAFHIIWFNELIYFWVFSIYCLVIADLGHDRGCTKEEADHLLSFQSIGELIGRLLLTIIADLHYLSNKNMTTLLLFIIAALLVVITQVTGFLMMATLTATISSFISLLYILLNGLLVDYLGERQVTLGYGMASCISGFLMYFRPQAVGYFRDHMGSYDWLLIWLSIACAITGLLWILEPLISRACSPKTDHGAEHDKIEDGIQNYGYSSYTRRGENGD